MERIRGTAFLDGQERFAQSGSDRVGTVWHVLFAVGVGKDCYWVDDRSGTAREKLGAFACLNLGQQVVHRNEAFMNCVAQVPRERDQRVTRYAGQDGSIERWRMQLATDDCEHIHP